MNVPTSTSTSAESNFQSPISGLTFIMLFFFLDVHNPKTHLLDGIKAIDWFGTFAILSCTIMLFVGLDLGGVTYA